MPEEAKPEQSVQGREIMPQFVNLFQVYVDAGHTRLIFGDAAWGKEGTFHSAVVMSTSDAVTLANLILELVNKQTREARADTSGSSQAIAMSIADAKKTTQ